MKHSKHHKKITVHKEGRFNPHRYWVTFFVCFVVIVILEVVLFSWYFSVTTSKLDAPATPSLQTNAAKIGVMEKSLETTEATVHERIGDVLPASQNAAPVVQ